MISSSTLMSLHATVILFVLASPIHSLWYTTSSSFSFVLENSRDQFWLVSQVCFDYRLFYEKSLSQFISCLAHDDCKDEKLFLGSTMLPHLSSSINKDDLLLNIAYFDTTGSFERALCKDTCYYVQKTAANQFLRRFITKFLCAFQPCPDNSSLRKQLSFTVIYTVLHGCKLYKATFPLFSNQLYSRDSTLSLLVIELNTKMI